MLVTSSLESGAEGFTDGLAKGEDVFNKLLTKGLLPCTRYGKSVVKRGPVEVQWS